MEWVNKKDRKRSIEGTVYSFQLCRYAQRDASGSIDSKLLLSAQCCAQCCAQHSVLSAQCCAQCCAQHSVLSAQCSVLSSQCSVLNVVVCSQPSTPTPSPPNLHPPPPPAAGMETFENLGCKTVKVPWRGVLALVGGFLIQLTLGSFYSFGNMMTYLTSYMRFALKFVFRGEPDKSRNLDRLMIGKFAKLLIISIIKVKIKTHHCTAVIRTKS